MSEHRFTVDQTSTGKPQYRHNLRYENPAGKAWTSPEGDTRSTLSGLTVVRCACGLATEALPRDGARLVYEEHRNAIRDEMT
ncbi:hypothetical protein [Streptomyces sp. NPDC002054]|uniref:hypothetical protein n=1 Tax=Streptomyces sp. NPDC002054 TaxID=3154663 RepID=UPI003330F8B6